MVVCVATVYMQQLLIDLPVSLDYNSCEHILALLDIFIAYTNSLSFHFHICSEESFDAVVTPDIVKLLRTRELQNSKVN